MLFNLHQALRKSQKSRMSEQLVSRPSRNPGGLRDGPPVSQACGNNYHSPVKVSVIGITSRGNVRWPVQPVMENGTASDGTERRRT